MLETLFKQESLTQEQSQAFFTQVVQGDVDPILLSAVLTALKIKGESPAEIAGAAAALRCTTRSTARFARMTAQSSRLSHPSTQKLPA